MITSMLLNQTNSLYENFIQIMTIITILCPQRLISCHLLRVPSSCNQGSLLPSFTLIAHSVLKLRHVYNTFIALLSLLLLVQE